MPVKGILEDCLYEVKKLEGELAEEYSVKIFNSNPEAYQKIGEELSSEKMALDMAGSILIKMINKRIKE